VLAGWAPDSLLDSYTAERHPIGAWVLDWTRAQIAIMRPEPHARALRQVVAALADTVQGTTVLAESIGGLRQRYDLPGSHPLVGRNVPPLRLADGSRLAEQFHDGQGVLVGRSAPGYAGRVREVPGADGLLVRPDGIVAWAADDAADEDGLTVALRTWFGNPTPTALHRRSSADHH
jgi:hypothetical protein